MNAACAVAAGRYRVSTTSEINAPRVDANSVFAALSAVRSPPALEQVGAQIESIRLRDRWRKDGNNILEFLGFASSLAPQSKSQLFQDLWVGWETGLKPDGFFVEFGAADGVLLSNTYMLEKTLGWRGVVADPNPAYQEALKRNRGCYTSGKCVYPTSGGSIGFLPFPRGEFSRIASVVPEDQHEGTGKRTGATEVLVETISLEDLLLEADAPTDIDYMSVDTEGSEFMILEAFHFDRWNVKLLSVEHNFTPMRDKLYDLLISKGYRRKWPEFSKFDDWYVLAR